MTHSLQQWRSESARSLARSRERREQPSPHPWPASAREWLAPAAIACGIALVGYLFLVFFGAVVWS
jgi:hypothetical protein